MTSGLADVPPVGIVEFARLRHVGGVAHRRAGVDPLRDGRDFVVAQRWIVLEALNPDMRIDAPRRHLPFSDALLDGSRPRPDILGRYQRHRPHLSGPMAALTRPLENRRDVLGERLCAGGGYADEGDSDGDG